MDDVKIDLVKDVSISFNVEKLDLDGYRVDLLKCLNVRCRDTTNSEFCVHDNICMRLLEEYLNTGTERSMTVRMKIQKETPLDCEMDKEDTQLFEMVMLVSTTPHSEFLDGLCERVNSERHPDNVAISISIGKFGVGKNENYQPYSVISSVERIAFNVDAKQCSEFHLKKIPSAWYDAWLGGEAFVGEMTISIVLQNDAIYKLLADEQVPVCNAFKRMYANVREHNFHLLSNDGGRISCDRSVLIDRVPKIGTLIDTHERSYTYNIPTDELTAKAFLKFVYYNSMTSPVVSGAIASKLLDIAITLDYVHLKERMEELLLAFSWKSWMSIRTTFNLFSTVKLLKHNQEIPSSNHSFDTMNRKCVMFLRWYVQNNDTQDEICPLGHQTGQHNIQYVLDLLEVFLRD